MPDLTPVQRDELRHIREWRQGYEHITKPGQASGRCRRSAVACLRDIDALLDALDAADAVIRRLAESDPRGMGYTPTVGYTMSYCVLCGAIAGADDLHATDCPWRMAREHLGLPGSGVVRPGTDTETEPVALRCGWCGHWEKGARTKEQVAEWLRVHRNATLGSYTGDQELASTCPRPCGTDTEATT